MTGGLANGTAADPPHGWGGHDLRLLPAAVAAWACCVVALCFPAGVWLLCGLLASTGAGCLWFARVAARSAAGREIGGRPALLRGSRRGRLGSGAVRTVALVLAAACCVGSAASVSVGLRLRSVRVGPLAEAARQAAVVDADVVLRDDPRVAESATGVGADHRYVVAPATAVRLRIGPREWRVRSPVLLVASATPLWTALLPSQRLSITGRAQPPRGHDLLAAVISVRGTPGVLGPPTRVQRVAGALRAGLAEAAGGVRQPVGGLLPGLVDGDTSALDRRLAADFRAAGMTHLVAVSGANIAILFAVVFALARRLWAPLRLAAILAGGALAGFVVVARPSPSVLRAAAMAAVLLIALVTGRRGPRLPALLAAVVMLLLFDPGLALEPGFALSALATAGLLVLAAPIDRRLRRRFGRRTSTALAAALAAQLACTPLIVAVWGQLSLVAVPANLLAEPAVPAATVLGVATAVAAPVSHPLARLLAQLAALPAWWLVQVAQHAARVPMGNLVLPPGWLTMGGLMLVTGVALVVGRRRNLRRVAAVVGAGGLLGWALPAAVAPGWPPAGWVFVACDVGQGDGLAVAAGPGQAVVVDTGPDPTPMDRCLRALRIRAVPVVVLSHLHADHAEGLPGVLGGRPVGGLVVGPLDEPAAESRRVRDWAAAARVPVSRAVLGESLRVGPVTLQVIGPAEVLHGTDSDPNNDSVVLRVTTAGVTLLLTGDVETPAQQALLRSGIPLAADVLKVPHHGSANQEPALLGAVHPKLAVVSVGAGNTYGQPAPTTMARFAAAAVPVHRTDMEGDIAVVVRRGRLGVAHRRTRPTPWQGAPVAWGVAAPARMAAGAASAAGAATRLPGGRRVSPGAARWSTTAVVGSPGGVRTRPPGRAARSPPAGPPVSGVAPGRAGGTGTRGRHGAAPAGGVHPGCPCHPRHVAGGDVLVPVTVVGGDEEFLVEREVSRVVAAARDADAAADLHDLTGAELTVDALLEALSPSLFGESRVVLVRRVQDAPADVQRELARYVADPAPDTVLVLTHAGGAKGKAMLATLQAAAGRVVDCPRIRWASERADFIRGEVRALGGRITEGAVKAIADAVGTDLRELATAVGQLVADSGGHVDDDVVARYYRGKAEATGFVIADRTVEGDPSGALELLRWGLGVGLAPVLVTSALAANVRAIAKVAAAGRGSPAALAKQLGMPSWKVERTQRQARGWRPEAIARALAVVAEADAAVKGGGADPGYALERAVLAVTAARDS